MFAVLKTSIRYTLITTVLLGLAYPMAITGLAQLLFPRQASGSLVLKDGRVIGSSLLGQSFTSDKYFHPRPSAAGNGYDAANSSGSNLAQSNRTLVTRIQGDIDKLSAQNGGKPVPIDLVTTSASGLDPDISPAAAYYQVERIAAARSIPAAQLNALVASHITARDLGLLGEPRVNVLALNMDLDSATK